MYNRIYDILYMIYNRNQGNIMLRYTGARIAQW